MPHYDLIGLANLTRDRIDRVSVEMFADEHRHHLGASVIGHDCEAYIWYAFRWARREIFSGRMLRLFNRGHLEEQRCIAFLRAAGFTVLEADPQSGRQFRIASADGHYGGSTDSLGSSPFPQFPERLVFEFKTHNDKSFKNLVNKKLIVAKPRHYAQMCSYGKAFQIEYGLYYAVNKNDDEIHIEIVKLDWGMADDVHRKADRIIHSKVRPTKIAMQPTYYECKTCPFQGPCHYGELIERNCRSCENAEPIDGGQWNCARYGVIPKEFLAVGCQDWKPVA